MADPRGPEGQHLIDHPSPAPAAGTDAARPPRWGLGDALGGFFLAYLFAAVASVPIYAAAGYSLEDDAPLWLMALTYPPLWLGFVGVPVWAAAKKGNGWITDFRVTARWSDVPLGLAIGVAAQLVLVPLISLPVLWATGQTSDDLARPAQELADKAVGAGGAVLFLVIVGICAPMAEELFYRGLVLRSFERRFAPWPALGLTSLWFGASHFQTIQLPALIAAGALFGLLVQRTGRLGLSVFTHMGFNLTTVAVLLWFT
jgi:membrane protease YdiL (CAAX protease family)